MPFETPSGAATYASKIFAENANEKDFFKLVTKVEKLGEFSSSDDTLSYDDTSSAGLPRSADHIRIALTIDENAVEALKKDKSKTRKREPDIDKIIVSALTDMASRVDMGEKGLLSSSPPIRPHLSRYFVDAPDGYRGDLEPESPYIKHIDLPLVPPICQKDRDRVGSFIEQLQARIENPLIPALPLP